MELLATSPALSGRPGQGRAAQQAVLAHNFEDWMFPDYLNSGDAEGVAKNISAVAEFA